MLSLKIKDIAKQRRVNDAFALFLSRNFYGTVYRDYKAYHNFPDGFILENFHNFFDQKIKSTLYKMHSTEDLEDILVLFENIFINFCKQNNIQYSEAFLNADHGAFST